MLFLVLVHIYMSSRNGQKDVTDTDSSSPDNMIDWDFFTDIIMYSSNYYIQCVVETFYRKREWDSL